MKKVKFFLLVPPDKFRYSVLKLPLFDAAPSLPRHIRLFSILIPPWRTPINQLKKIVFAIFKYMSRHRIFYLLAHVNSDNRYNVCFWLFQQNLNGLPRTTSPKLKSGRSMPQWMVCRKAFFLMHLFVQALVKPDVAQWVFGSKYNKSADGCLNCSRLKHTIESGPNHLLHPRSQTMRHLLYHPKRVNWNRTMKWSSSIVSTQMQHHALRHQVWHQTI